MTNSRRRRLTPTGAVRLETADDSSRVSEVSPTDSEAARRRLRQRWELASVLNFLRVFEPVVATKMEISAEEIEAALITPNNLLSQLHITLLKGIPPVSKNLNSPNAWVTVLCKKLDEWWQWVAEGDIPLTTAKGEEITRYKQLEPTIRLLLLKALCEIRAVQDDIISYVNDALKNGTEPSYFRKEKIGGDGNGTTYWCDGNVVIGYRLYKELKEVSKIESKSKVNTVGSIPALTYDWETLATNLEEFRRVMDEFSSSESRVEVAVGKTIETDVIPDLEKLHKKKVKTLKQQRRQELLLNGFHNAGITRSCRTRRPAKYTFDEYDRAIDEAIQQTKKRKTTEELRQEVKHSDRGERKKNASNACSDTEADTRKSSVDSHCSLTSDTESDELDGSHRDDDNYDMVKDDGDNEKGGYSSSSDKEFTELGNRDHAALTRKQTQSLVNKRFGSRWSERLVRTTNRSVSQTQNLGAKNRSRQRPTRNSALESTVVPDSEDGRSSDDASNRMSGSEKSGPADLVDVSDSENTSDDASNQSSGSEKSPSADLDDGSEPENASEQD